jgi:glycerol-3-phosphate dehydrogenase
MDPIPGRAGIAEFSRRLLVERPRTSAAPEEFDVAVIGGGATGAGIARDAALRGMTVALIEKGDFAAGSSSKSSKMIHGGLRYLKQLEIGLVRESLHERAILLRIAPHLVRPIPHLIPAYGGGRKKLELRVGMLGYEALAGAQTLVPFEELSRSEVLRREPLLNPNDLEAVSFTTTAW